MRAAVNNRRIVRIPEQVWRQAAKDHQEKIRALVEPGMVSLEEDRHYRLLRQRQERLRKQSTNDDVERQSKDELGWCRPLNALHPVYNFLIEYYGLKGVKGTKRLARWAPSPNLLLQSAELYQNVSQLEKASSLRNPNGLDLSSLHKLSITTEDGVLLEGATPDDMSSLLHLRGAMYMEDSPDCTSSGVLYSPGTFFEQKAADYYNHQNPATTEKQRSCQSHPASAFLWYRSILQQTIQAEPILHCYGLHEWAMQYHPPASDPPPSGKYQSHLSLRVSRESINETVERRGVSCTHVDALRFFAPAAAPLNHHGAVLKRMDQLRLEQPACVHAHMDLLKIALRLQPFCDPFMLQRILQISLDARILDVAASPYDATGYGVGVIPIESADGRAQYRRDQMALMQRVKPIRQELLNAYDAFLYLAFGEEVSKLESQVMPAAERFAQAEPGGKPWRRNLIATSTT